MTTHYPFDTKRDPVWALEGALAFVRSLDKAVRGAGYSVALGGSVLLRGESRKDLDLIVFPLSTAKQDLGALKKVLIAQGLTLQTPRYEVTARWVRDVGSEDAKRVEVWDYDGRRVDLLFLS